MTNLLCTARFVRAATLAVALSGCTDGGQTTDDAPGQNPCRGAAQSTDEPPAEVLARYEYDTDDILSRALGRWEGRYPGGNTVGALDVTVEVDLPESGRREASFGFTDFERWDETCAGAVLDVEGSCDLAPTLIASGGEALGTLPIGGLAIRGYVLAEGSPGNEEPVSGQVEFHAEAHLQAAEDLGEASGETEFGLVFTSSAELWMSITVQGTPLDFKKVGERVSTAVPHTDAGSIGPDGGR